ncbi:hypothetical protein EP7_000448 [Isosphaeraceae bacterium EP7]
MTKRRFVRPLLFLVPLAVFLPPLLTGCGDDTRTTGSQLKISEKAKAQVNDMREMYKSNASKKAMASKKR